MHRWLNVFVITLLVLSSTVGAANLAENGGMEGAKVGKLPPHWEPFVVGVPATMASDTAEKHGGQASVKIVASESARSYIRSTEPIQVSPGEEIRASAWAKLKDVPTEKGTTIFIADFTDAKGQNESVQKFEAANAKKPNEWQPVDGVTKVPALATALKLRLGFSYSQGTVWWDDVTVRAVKPLVCRLDLPEARLTPAMKTIPVTILNRDAAKGPVTVHLMLGKKSTDAKVSLNGDGVQVVEVPIIVPKPGKIDISATLLQDGAELFTSSVKATIPPPLVLSPPSPTHWAIEDGAPTIDAWIDLAVSDEQREGAKLQLRLQDSAGASPASTSLNSGVENGVRKMSIQAKALPLGDYTLIAEFIPAKGPANGAAGSGVIRVEQPWHVIPRKLAKVTLTAGGFPQYDGKAIFPLGIFNGGKFKEQAAAGFTVTHAYNAVRVEPNWMVGDSNAFNFIDNTGANGMKALFMIPMKLAIAGDYEGVRRRVRMFRNHPALLAWDEEEGFARGDFKPDTLKKIRQIISEEDPNHPFMVGDSRDVIGHMAKDRSDMFPVADMDLGMWWWYPFPLKPAGTGDALEGDEGTRGNEIVPPGFLVNSHIKKPLWVGVQSYKKTKDSRYPTPTEYRAQAYTGIIHGAKGLMWYGGSVTGGLFLAPEEGHWDDLKKLATELHGLQPLLISPPLDVPTISPDKTAVNVCLKQSADRTVLIAANQGAAEADVTFSSPLLKGASAKVISENRDVKVTGGSIHDKFEPYAVHLYELAR
jgi:hypothetical protein